MLVRSDKIDNWHKMKYNLICNAQKCFANKSLKFYTLKKLGQQLCETNYSKGRKANGRAVRENSQLQRFVLRQVHRGSLLCGEKSGRPLMVHHCDDTVFGR